MTLEVIMNDDKKKTGEALEGEGSYTATHNYDAGVAKSVSEGKSEELAKKAKQALEGPEGKELRAAEKKAKARAAKR
jgi:hypothetical protein